MTITATVYEGRITLPSNVILPDGTQVEILLPREHVAFSLPTFKGDGLQPGVDLDDSRALRDILDADSKLSPLP